ncbi:MAG: ABC transporter ATP-binding protein [Bdellovibrionales bacterium]|nr:ABC transporter ATP-binding protein [Bdellovibrionales bacterium]
MDVLKVSNLVKNYGSFCAVNGVSLKVQKGEILGLLGPNGAGKTSLIHSIVTVEDFQKGSIEVCGYNLKKEIRLCKSMIGYMPQEIINHSYFNVEEVLYYHSGYYGCFNNKDYIEHLMKKFALWEHRKKRIIQLSGGMRRRLLLAKSLVHNPELLLLDEPTSGVDVSLRDDIWEFVRRLRDEGKAILFTTHYLEEAEKLCDRVAIIHKGELVRHNKTISLIQEFTLRKLGVQLKTKVNVVHKYLKLNTENYLEFHIPFSLDIGRLLEEAGLSLSQIQDIQIQEGSLEDVFKDVLDGE